VILNDLIIMYGLFGCCGHTAAHARTLHPHTVYSPILKYVEGVNVENLVAAQTWLTAEWMT
jgi:hypothetical protein